MGLPKEGIFGIIQCNESHDLMRMANWHQGPSPITATDAFHEIDQLGGELIDMNDSNKIDTDGLVVIWYLRALREEYSTLKGTVMSLDVNLDKSDALRRVIDFNHMRIERKENASRAQFKQERKRASDASRAKKKKKSGTV